MPSRLEQTHSPLQDVPSPSITRREWHSTIGVALFILLLIGLPYAVGAWSSTPDRVFTGFLVGRIGLEDDRLLSGQNDAGCPWGVAGLLSAYGCATPQYFVFSVLSLIGRVMAGRKHSVGRGFPCSAPGAGLRPCVGALSLYCRVHGVATRPTACTGIDRSGGWHRLALDLVWPECGNGRSTVGDRLARKLHVLDVVHYAAFDRSGAVTAGWSLASVACGRFRAVAAGAAGWYQTGWAWQCCSRFLRLWLQAWRYS